MGTLFSRHDQEQLRVIDGPVWENRCDHGGYLCSFEADKQYDLYIFYDQVQQICLRSSLLYPEHFTLPEFLVQAAWMGKDRHKRVASILQKTGGIEWSPLKADAELPYAAEMVRSALTFDEALQIRHIRNILNGDWTWGSVSKETEEKIKAAIKEARGNVKRWREIAIVAVGEI